MVVDVKEDDEDWVFVVVVAAVVVVEEVLIGINQMASTATSSPSVGEPAETWIPRVGSP